jgi:phage terminase large subunit-like protein
MPKEDAWKKPEVIQLYNEIQELQAIIERRLKENRIEIYNTGDKVHKKQIEFHKSPKRIKGLFGGNRTGKTVAGAVEAVLHALGDSRYRKLKPSSGWVVSLTNEVQRDVAQKEVLKWLPKKEIQDIIIRHGRKSDPENSIIDKIVLKNGQTIGFKTVEQGREAFQGTSQAWIWFDEEPPKDIYDECWMRIIDTKGDMWFTMTPLKGLTFVYDLIYLNERNDPEIDYWMMEWEDNPWLDKEEIERMIANMPEEEREARQYGRFTSLSGFGLPELRKEIHIKPKIAVPEWYYRYVSLDYGFDSLAVLWVWVDKFGNARVYRALRKKNLIISEAAQEIKRHTLPNERIEAYYAPPDLWNRRQDTGKSAAMIFYEHGIPLTRVSNDRVQGWLNVREWIAPFERRDEQTGEVYKTARLTFDEGLDPDLWKHLTTIQKDENNPNDLAKIPHEVTHYPDALRHFCVSRMEASVEPPEEQHYNFSFERPQTSDSYFGGEVTEDYLSYS